MSALAAPTDSLQQTLARVLMGMAGGTPGAYSRLVQHGDDALKALDTVFPGRMLLDGDIGALFVEPLDEIGPVLEALRHFGTHGLDVLQRQAKHSDPGHRLASARALVEFSHARAGRLLAELSGDSNRRVAEAAACALRSGRHPGGLRRAREAAVEALVCSGFSSPDAWERCTNLDTGQALSVAARLPWRRLKSQQDAIGALSWHPGSHQPELFRALGRAPGLPLVRIRVRALAHPDTAVRRYAQKKLGRSRFSALAFDPEASDSFTRDVIERFKRAHFDQ